MHGKKWKKIQCPCCGYFTQAVGVDDKKPYHCFEMCDVCFWQYDEVAHDKPDISTGANHISLNEAIENYKKNKVCKEKFLHLVREPLPEEFPENNV